jgi:hypothetical protein
MAAVICSESFFAAFVLPAESFFASAAHAASASPSRTRNAATSPPDPSGAVHRVDPPLELAQPLRVQVDPVAVAAQTVRRFLQLDARGLERLENVAQARIELRQCTEPRHDLVHLRQRGVLALGENLGAELRRFEQARGVCQPGMLLGQLLPLAGRQAERLELPHLPFELGALGRVRQRVGLGIHAGLAPLPPLAEEHCHFPGGLSETAVRVQQLALRRRPRERLVLVLAVYVHQELAELAQLGQRRRPAVDIAPRASAGLDDAAHEAGALVARQVVVRQPAPRRRLPGRIELAPDLGPLGAGPHDDGLGPGAQHHAERVDQDGLAGAGLPGEHREPGSELELQAVDDHEIANRERSQHVMRLRVSMGRRDS